MHKLIFSGQLLEFVHGRQNIGVGHAGCNGFKYEGIVHSIRLGGVLGGIRKLDCDAGARQLINAASWHGQLVAVAVSPIDGVYKQGRIDSPLAGYPHRDAKAVVGRALGGQRACSCTGFFHRAKGAGGGCLHGEAINLICPKVHRQHGGVGQGG